MDEAARLARLTELAVLDTPPEPLFDGLTRIAASQCEVPVALVGLIDTERQWFKAQVGFEGTHSTPRRLSFCDHVLQGPDAGRLMEVPDALEDPRFATHPQVVGAPHIRFYAGAPLRMPGGELIGTLCVVDHRPRRLTDAQRRLLVELADAVVQGLIVREQALKLALVVKSRHEAELTSRAGALNSILDDLPAAVAVWNRELSCTYANRVHEDWYGPARRGAQPMRLQELLPPVVYERSRPVIEQVLAGATRTQISEFEWGRGPRHRRVQYSPYRDPGDAAGAIVGFTVLITDETATRENAHLQASVAALMANSNDAIYTTDGQGRILSWNRGAERLYGYTESEMLGRDPMALAAEAERAALWQARQRLYEDGELPVLEGPRVRKDGGRLWVSVNAYRLPEAAGNLARYVVVQRDITPLKAAEAAVRESEQRFRVLTEAAPLAVFHAGADGGNTFVNEAWCRLFGLSTSDAMGHGWTRGLHPADAEAVFDAWRAATARGEAFSMRFRAQRPDGEVREAHARANAVRAADGTVTGFVGVVQDITERERAQAALEKSRESLRQLYEATPAMLHSCDDQGRLLSVSDTWLEKLGWQRSEVIGRAQGDFMAETSRRYIAETAWPQLMKHGRVANVPLRMLPRGGEEMYVVMSARFEPQGPGESPRALRVLAVMEDVTVALRHSLELQREQMLRAEVERRAEELAVLLRERSEMLDVLAHEVRQPLNNAWAALQSAEAVLGARDPGVAARLRRAAQVLAEVRGGIDNTLAAAALLASDEPLAVQDSDVDLLVALTLGDLDATERSRVRVEREGATRTAAMDVSLMRLGLRNLLVNALRYSPPESPVTLAISDSDEPLALLIEVRDTGGGFEADFVPRMFQRGMRGSAAAGKRIAGGTGLGLYIVHRILQMHGGSVVLAHNRPGDVRMRLLLPPARDE